MNEKDESATTTTNKNKINNITDKSNDNINQINR